MQEAREVAVDVEKYLAFASTGRFSWTHHLERSTPRAFVTHLDSQWPTKTYVLVV
jgi:hypothetical protein